MSTAKVSKIHLRGRKEEKERREKEERLFKHQLNTLLNKCNNKQKAFKCFFKKKINFIRLSTQANDKHKDRYRTSHVPQ